MVKTPTTWKCPTCSSVLGSVVNGELHPSGEHKVRTRGANLEIVCNECGYNKVWYTNDSLLRAMHQLVSVISAETAKSTIRQISKAQQEMFPNKPD